MDKMSSKPSPWPRGTIIIEEKTAEDLADHDAHAPHFEHDISQTPLNRNHTWDPASTRHSKLDELRLPLRRHRSFSVSSQASLEDPAGSSTSESRPYMFLEKDKNTGLEEVSAMTLVPIRHGKNGFEVLMAQNEVYNYFRSRPPDYDIMSWPGEWRFPGGRQYEGDGSPLATGLRNLVQLCPGLGLESMNTSDLKATLYRKSISKNRRHLFHVYTFIAFVEENPWLNIDTEVVNGELERRRQKYWKAVEDNTWETWSPEELAQTATRVHVVKWLPVAEGMKVVQPSKKFVNDWQRQEFQKYDRCTRREVPRGTWLFLRDLSTASNQQTFMDRCIENVIKQIAMTKNMTEEQWRNELFARSGISHAGFFQLNQIRLLSLNLNILPRGINFFAGTGHGFADLRLELFIKLMSRENYDVVCLQEVFASPFLPMCRQRYLLKEMRKLGYAFQVRSPKPGLSTLFVSRKWTDSGLLILSKFPIMRQDKLSFVNSGYHLDQGATKGALFAKIQFGERALLVFNTHLQATHSRDPALATGIRHKQLLELQEFIKRNSHFSRGVPWILAGDFNIDAISVENEVQQLGYSWFEASHESEEYQHMFSLLSSDRDWDVVDLLKGANNGHHPSTRPPRLQLPTSLRYMTKHKYPQRLDYLFFSPGSLGELQPVVSATRVVKFEISREEELLLTPKLRESASRENIKTAEYETFTPTHRKKPTTLPFRYVSDHFGVASTLHCLNTFTWSKRSKRERKKTFSSQDTSSRRRKRVMRGLYLLRRVLMLMLVLVPVLIAAQCFLHPDWIKAVEDAFISATGLNIPFLHPDLHSHNPTCVNAAVNLLASSFTEGYPMRQQAPVSVHISASPPGLAWRVPAVSISLPVLMGSAALVAAIVVYFRSLRASRSTFPHTAKRVRPMPELKTYTDIVEPMSVIHRSPWSPQDLVAVDSDHPHNRTLYDVFLHAVEQHSYRPCLGVRELTKEGLPMDSYRWITYDKLYRRVRKFGSGLIQLRPEGVDCVGILAENSPEWVIADISCAMHSMVSVPMFSVGTASLRSVIEETNVKVIVCSRRWTLSVLRCLEEMKYDYAHDADTSTVDMDSADTAAAIGGANLDDSPRAATPPLERECSVFCIVQIDQLLYDEQAKAAELGVQLHSFDYVETKGSRNIIPPTPPDPSDIATIIYKPRHKGRPVGCQVTHANLVAALTGLGQSLGVMSSDESLQVNEKDVYFSFHSLAHALERQFVYFSLRQGARIGFLGGLSHFYDDVRILQPTLMTGAPALFCNLYSRFNRVQKAWQKLYKWSFHKALRYKLAQMKRTQSKSLIRWLDRLFFRPAAKQLGGHLRFVIITGGYLDESVHAFIEGCLCCHVVRGLGFPETSGFASLGKLSPDAHWEEHVSHNRLGWPVTCLEMKVVPLLPSHGAPVPCASGTPSSRQTPEEYGELCVRGPALFAGYMDAQRRAAADGQGWWHSGRVVQFNDDGSVTDIGSKKTFVRMKGGLINVSRLEAIYAQGSDFAHQVWVHPSSCQRFLVAVVSVNHEIFYEWSKKQGHDVYDIQAICHMNDAKREILRDFAKVHSTNKLQPQARVLDVHLTDTPFDVQSGLSTPTAKYIREELLRRFDSYVKHMVRTTSAKYEELVKDL